MVVVKPICVNGSNCQGTSKLPPCVGNCGGGGGSGGGSFPEWDINDAYVVDTVVLYNGLLYAANSDIPPGTPFEIGDIPGTWRNLQAGSATLPPFNPESSYAQYRATLYEGRIYISNAALPAGPFNPADWTEVLVTGAVSTQDTVTVDLTGNGTAGDPLTASLNLDPSPDNLLTLTPEGLSLPSSVIPTPGGGNAIISQGVTLNVDVVNGDDSTADGSFGKAYATLDAAIAAATANDVIRVWPGTYAPPTGLKNNLSIIAVSDRVTFNGPMVITVSNFRMKGVTLNGAVTLNNSSGGVTLEDITLGNNNVVFTGQNSGTFFLRALSMSGTIIAEDAAQAAVALTVVVLGDALGTPSLRTDVTNGRFYVGGRQNVGNVLHRKGLLALVDIARILNVDHTAAAATANLLYVKNVSNLNPQSGVHATVSKTGDASFYFDNFARDATTDESGFSGVKTLIEQARDIHGNYTPVNYNISRQDLSAHLKGIDDALSGITSLKPINIAFSLVGGWDADEILFAHVTAQGDITFGADFEGSFATSDVSFDAGIELLIVGPGGGAAQTFGTITFTNGTASFSGGGNTAAEGSTIILKAVGTANFGFLAITLAATSEV